MASLKSLARASTLALQDPADWATPALIFKWFPWISKKNFLKNYCGFKVRVPASEEDGLVGDADAGSTLVFLQIPGLGVGVESDSLVLLAVDSDSGCVLGHTLVGDGFQEVLLLVAVVFDSLIWVVGIRDVDISDFQLEKKRLEWEIFKKNGLRQPIQSKKPKRYRQGQRCGRAQSRSHWSCS